MTDTDQSVRPVPRRRFQFSLRRLLIITAIAGMLLAVAAPEIGRHRRATRAAREINALGGSVHWNPEVYETLYYDHALTRITDVWFSNPSFTRQQWAVLQALPQRFGLHVSGSAFSDASLDQLHEMPNLRYLVLNKTSVTDGGIAQFKKRSPQVRVMYGYPGDPDFREVP